jgi:ankyrin repeat protein
MPEEEFVPGVDPGIKVWKLQREALRKHLKTQGKSEFTIPCKSRYDHCYYWENELKTNYINPDEPGKVIEGMHCSLLLSEFKERTTRVSTKEAILIAMNHRHTQFINYLIQDKKVSPNFVISDNKNTLLHYAAGDGDEDKIEYLLKHGAKVNARDIHRRTPMFYGIKLPAILHPVSLLQQLVDFGCNINAVDDRGFSVLHQACLLNDLNFIEFLLKNRVKVAIKDKKGKVALEYAKEVSEVATILCLIRFF